MHVSHIAQLELSHDGVIPHRLRRAAEALDRIEAAARKPAAARTRLRVVRYTPRGQVERLAEAMVALNAGDRPVTRADLIARGFAPDTLDTYADRAAARASEIKAARERRS